MASNKKNGQQTAHRHAMHTRDKKGGHRQTHVSNTVGGTLKLVGKHKQHRIQRAESFACGVKTVSG